MINIHYAPNQESNHTEGYKPPKKGLLRPLQWRHLLLHPFHAWRVLHHLLLCCRHLPRQFLPCRLLLHPLHTWHVLHHLCRCLPHRLPPRPHTLRTIPLIHRQRPVHRRQKRPTRPTRTPLRHRNERIIPHPVSRVLRHIPRQRPITHASQRIQVRPRPLTTPTRVLLNRRIPRRYYRRNRPALRPNGLPSRPKVQQHRRTIHIA